MHILDMSESQLEVGVTILTVIDMVMFDIKTASFALRTGMLYPMNGKPSHFLDRLHLGGPTSVRMFKMNGIGPRDHSESARLCIRYLKSIISL